MLTCGLRVSGTLATLFWRAQTLPHTDMRGANMVAHVDRDRTGSGGGRILWPDDVVIGAHRRCGRGAGSWARAGMIAGPISWSIISGSKSILVFKSNAEQRPASMAVAAWATDLVACPHTRHAPVI